MISFSRLVRAVRPSFFAVVLLAVFAAGLNAAHYRTIEGASAEGAHAVIILALPAYSQTIGVADQVKTIPLERGRLTIIETHGDPRSGQAAGMLTSIGATGANQPDWVWVHEGTTELDSEGERLATPAIGVAGEKAAELVATVQAALADEVELAVRAANNRLARIANHGVLTVQYPANVPASRQNRYSRELTVALLRQAGMIAEDERFDWNRLQNRTGTLVAIYDAEGVGEAGAQNLERITVSKIDGVGTYRVCGEDIREGALSPAVTAIFPGGSGRGIGNGLQDEGREILRDYVTSGGGYLGVCAGAYFAGSGLENYMGAIDLRHSQPWARGRGIVEMELTEEGRKLFGDDKTIIRTRFANGPVFLPEDQDGEGDPNFVVLARFTTPSTDRDGVVREEMVGEAAVGALTYGDGRVLIISPHPESHREHYDFVGRAISWTMGRD